MTFLNYDSDTTQGRRYSISLLVTIFVFNMQQIEYFFHADGYKSIRWFRKYLQKNSRECSDIPLHFSKTARYLFFRKKFNNVLAAKGCRFAVNYSAKGELNVFQFTLTTENKVHFSVTLHEHENEKEQVTPLPTGSCGSHYNPRRFGVLNGWCQLLAAIQGVRGNAAQLSMLS